METLDLLGTLALCLFSLGRFILASYFIYLASYKLQVQGLTKETKNGEDGESTLNEKQRRLVADAKKDFLCISWVLLYSGFISVVEIQNFVFDGTVIPHTNYIDWIISTPLMVYSLCLTAKIDVISTILVMGLQVMMIACGFLGDISKGNVFEWIWFGIGSLVFIVEFTFLYFKSKAFWRQGDLWAAEEINLSRKLVLVTVSTWTVYPIIWLLDHLEVVPSGPSTAVLTVCRLASKAGFGFILYWYKAKLLGDVFPPIWKREKRKSSTPVVELE